LQCYKEHMAAFRIQQYWFKAKHLIMRSVKN
jgi:hypothetical protein